jgi:hypothetical protein
MHVLNWSPDAPAGEYFPRAFFNEAAAAYIPDVMGREGPEINLDIKSPLSSGIKMCVHNIPFEITA